MDLIHANMVVDVLMNTAHDLHNLAVEEMDPVVREWLHRRSDNLSSLSLEVVALPLEGFVMPSKPAMSEQGE